MLSVSEAGASDGSQGMLAVYLASAPASTPGQNSPAPAASVLFPEAELICFSGSSAAELGWFSELAAEGLGWFSEIAAAELDLFSEIASAEPGWVSEIAAAEPEWVSELAALALSCELPVPGAWFAPVALVLTGCAFWLRGAGCWGSAMLSVSEAGASDGSQSMLAVYLASAPASTPG
jgi:hypothetical protein